jgi:hypothetical protein
MNILSSLKSGFLRALNTRKGVLIVWFSLFVMVLLFIYPLRGSINSAFGRSMITEKLAEGFNIEVFADLGSTIKSLLSFLTAGFMLVYLVGFVLNAFMTAGLFGSVRNESGKFSSPEFFRAGSKNFWSFLVISFIVSAMMKLVSGFVIGIPLIIVHLSENTSEKGVFTVVVTAIVVCFLILPVFFLIADYARAWKAANENASCWKAIGFGISRTFGKFWQSYIMMILLIAAQIVLGVLIILFLQVWKPVTGGGVFLLLIISQIMLYVRLLLKTWRYASVTSMMEHTGATGPGNL